MRRAMDLDDPEQRIPLSEALDGFGVHPLPPGWTALEAFVVIKCLDEEGESVWSYRTTHRPNREELLGVLTVQVELLRRKLLREWDDEDDEGDG